MDQIYLREARKDVDKKYVGFTPNGSSVKPVHIAGGSLRCIYGEYNRTKTLRRWHLFRMQRVTFHQEMIRIPFLMSSHVKKR